MFGGTVGYGPDPSGHSWESSVTVPIAPVTGEFD
jgi:hypothetical protein